MGHYPLINFADSKCNVAIETGTYFGETTQELISMVNFKQVHSVELSNPLAVRAKLMFHDNPFVKIWQGDSSYCLPYIFEHISNTLLTVPKCFVLLDAHYSGGETVTLDETASPLLQELHVLEQFKEMIKTIVIDDVNVCYDLENPGAERNEYTRGWPTISEVKEVLYRTNPNFRIEKSDLRPLGALICKSE